MAVKKGQVLDVTITDVAFGGRGLVKIDGLAVFVDLAVPQDTVRIRIRRKKRNYAEARVLELLAPSPHRVDAPCPYSGLCGGCKWQFLSYPKQLEYKKQHVVEALEHIAMLNNVPVHDPIPSELRFGYRNKMEFSFSDRRWLLPSELGDPAITREFALGLHVPGTFDKILDTQVCYLHPELGNQLVADVRDYARQSSLPPYGLKSHQGFWRFLMLRHSVARDQWMVNLISAAEAPETLQPLAERLMAAHPQVVAVVNNITARKAGVAVGEYERHLTGETAISDRIGSYEFEISANSFFQTNTRSAARLYETVRAYAGLTGSQSVLDLYCGTGTIAIFLAADARHVTGMEIVESAVTDAIQNCERNRVTNCRFVLGDIRRQLVQIDTRPDVMIIDPPRAGMHKDVVKQVVALAPPRIVYVSCNPATMARDLIALKEHYAVCEVQPVDMFPHTYHIEAVARLEQKKSR